MRYSTPERHPLRESRQLCLDDIGALSRLDTDGRLQVASLNCVEVSEHQFFREKSAVRFLILFAHDREGLEDVLGVVPLDSVEVEEQRIEPCHAVTTVFLVPLKRVAAVAGCAREWLKIPRGVGQSQYFAAYEITNILFAQRECAFATSSG